jgi:hypothetical protein
MTAMIPWNLRIELIYIDSFAHDTESRQRLGGGR